MNEQRLINAFYSSFWLFLILLLTLIIFLTLCIVFWKKIFTLDSYGKYANIIKFTLIFILFLGLSISGYFFSIRALDLQSVKTEDFIYIEGKIVRFMINREGNDPTKPIHRYPIVLNMETGEEIMIRLIDEVEIDTTHEIIYLENSKIGVLNE